jgi:hypothetical protein
MEKNALELLEEVAEALTDFVVDDSVPQEIRDRLVPTTGAIDEFLADTLLEEEDADYEEDEYDEELGDEDSCEEDYDDDEDYEDDEELVA